MLESRFGDLFLQTRSSAVALHCFSKNYHFVFNFFHT